MASETETQDTVVRTARGLSIAGTRVTLYSVIDCLKADWPPRLIRDRLNLTDRQIHDVMSYIDTHRNQVESEHARVIKQADENKQYWQERNKHRFDEIARRPRTADKKATWDRLQAKKSSWE